MNIPENNVFAFDDEYEKYMEAHEAEELIEFDYEGARILLCTPVVLVKGFDTDLYAAEGVWCEKYEDGEYMPDWDLTWFWGVGRNPWEPLYFEQDALCVSTHNLSHTTGACCYSMEIVEEVPKYEEEKSGN